MLHNKAQILKTDRLCLRQLSDKDRDAAIDLFTDREVGKTYMVPDFACREDAIPLFETVKRLSCSPERFVYGICLQETLIGLINDVGIEDGRIELGYVICPGQKGKGYATEALGAAIRELFRLGFSAVKAGAFQENRASMRVMEKCGMTPTGEQEQIPYRGKVHACINYEIRKPE